MDAQLDRLTDLVSQEPTRKLVASPKRGLDERVVAPKDLDLATRVLE